MAVFSDITILMIAYDCKYKTTIIHNYKRSIQNICLLYHFNLTDYYYVRNDWNQKLSVWEWETCWEHVTDQTPNLWHHYNTHSTLVSSDHPSKDFGPNQDFMVHFEVRNDWNPKLSGVRNLSGHVTDQTPIQQHMSPLPLQDSQDSQVSSDHP